MKKFYPLLSILLLIGCNPSSTTTNTSNPINIEEFSLSGRDVLVVKVGEKLKELKKSVGSSLDKEFSLTNGSNRFIKYSELENQYGKVLGKSKIKDKNYLIIQMNERRRVKIGYLNWDMKYDMLPSFLVSVDKINELKKLVGEIIWLNKTDDFSSLYNNTTFFTHSNKSFNRFDEVEIVDIYPLYMGGSDRPIWLKVKSKVGDFGYVKYDDIPNKKGFDLYYYSSNPLPKEWGDEVIELVKNGKIRIGMTERQVRVSRGNPSDINTTITQYTKREQWVYKQSSYKSSYVYVENGKVVSIQN
jgi:hypothetical protein